MDKYKKIYHKLKSVLLGSQSSDTTKITSLIKGYFGEEYSRYHVAGAAGNPEFLFDITVCSCNPLNVHENTEPEYKVYLVAESELGGSSASSSIGVERNTIEDFFKLLVVNSELKVMIAAYSVPDGDIAADVLKLRVQKLSEINEKSENATDILVVYIKGAHNLGNSRQIKLVSPLEVNGFVLKRSNIYSAVNDS